MYPMKSPHNNYSRETPGIQGLSHGILSYIMGFLFSFGNTVSVFIGAYIIYTMTHKILGYLYKVVVLREAHGWTREVLFCCCSDFLQMRKYRADYRSAKSNARGYDAGSLSRRPPSKGSDALKDQGCSGNPKVS